MAARIKKTIVIPFRKAFALLQNNDPLILASSTAFFSTFALSPIIIILVSVFSLYFTAGKFNNQLFRTIGTTFGAETSREIESIVNNFKAMESNIWITIGGSVFLVFIATTLMGVVKKAINKIWHIRPKPEHKLSYHSRERGTGLGLLLLTGLLFLVSFLVDAMMAVSMDYLIFAWPAIAIKVIHVLNTAFSIIVVTLWFTVIFKWLPDARISWDVAMSGGLLTGLLFSLGKFGLGKLLIHSRIATIFGASASFALLLLFIFYCSFIVYYGAAFTHTYAEVTNSPICASKHADEYIEKVVKKDTAQLTEK